MHYIIINYQTGNSVVATQIQRKITSRINNNTMGQHIITTTVPWEHNITLPWYTPTTNYYLYYTLYTLYIIVRW